ncbi:hypothetical protein T11_2212 [Trichinella zimbabwensis]|uniref:Uncharacterized protein n=1 Tax=Trichinella zimbabwensis TaxID=268475 RepID=A0A0V1HQH0_9BILA|nr:hypothetical protein T11_2212 [Trichinella zimbabwensis]
MAIEVVNYGTIDGAMLDQNVEIVKLRADDLRPLTSVDCYQSALT